MPGALASASRLWIDFDEIHDVRDPRVLRRGDLVDGAEQGRVRRLRSDGAAGPQDPEHQPEVLPRESGRRVEVHIQAVAPVHGAPEGAAIVGRAAGADAMAGRLALRGGVASHVLVDLAREVRARVGAEDQAEHGRTAVAGAGDEDDPGALPRRPHVCSAAGAAAARAAVISSSRATTSLPCAPSTGGAWPRRRLA